MQKTIAKGLFYAVATILILWTGSLTYAFVATALPQAHWLVPLFALVVFDVGTLAWLKSYLDLAEGSGQRALALVMCVFDFLGVGLMVLAEILLGGQNLVSAPPALGEYAIWGIAIWTVINVGAVITWHLMPLKPGGRWHFGPRWTWYLMRRYKNCQPSAPMSAVSYQTSFQME